MAYALDLLIALLCALTAIPLLMQLRPSTAYRRTLDAEGKPIGGAAGAETVATETAFGVEYPVEMVFRRGASGEHRVHLRVEKLDFTTPIPDEFFSVVTLARRAR